MTINFWLYVKLKPYWEKLETHVRELERQRLQAIEYEKAEIADKKFRENMTLERYKRLTERPNQKQCSHLKGGRSGVLCAVRDYAISVHTFSDGRTEVKCLICGKQFDLKDPTTKEMIGRSTNSPTSCEMLIQIPEGTKWT